MWSGANFDLNVFEIGKMVQQMMMLSSILMVGNAPRALPTAVPGAEVQAALAAAAKAGRSVYQFPNTDVYFGPKERLECVGCKHIRLLGGPNTTLWFQPGTTPCLCTFFLVGLLQETFFSSSNPISIVFKAAASASLSLKT